MPSQSKITKEQYFDAIKLLTRELDQIEREKFLKKKHKRKIAKAQRKKNRSRK